MSGASVSHHRAHRGTERSAIESTVAASAAIRAARPRGGRDERHDPMSSGSSVRMPTSRTSRGGSRTRAGLARCRATTGAVVCPWDISASSRSSGGSPTTGGHTRLRSTGSRSSSPTSMVSETHFLHVRSDDPDATPLMLTHGYPSSVAEFSRLIDMLVDPGQGPAFHVVAPSLPGYAFSTPLSGPGWTMGRTARAWVELARRLGYQRYGVHGGDIGAGVSGMVAALDAEHVLGMHVVTDPMTAASAATFIPGLADRLDPADPVDRVALDRMAQFRTEGMGYLAITRTAGRRPSATGSTIHPCSSWHGSARSSTHGPTCPSTATCCSPMSPSTGSPARASPPPTRCMSRRTRTTGERRRPCRRGTPCSVPTPPSAG